MAHLSVENVLIFLWHCYVEVFDFFLPLSLPSLFSCSPPSSLSPSPSCSIISLFFLSFGGGEGSGVESRSSATVCLSAFRFELTQQKQDFLLPKE